MNVSFPSWPSWEVLPSAGTTLLVAVSGGYDSMFLLHTLHQAGCWNLRVFHLDHQLRTESAADAAFVAQWCQQQGIAADVECCDIAALARAQRVSIETAARQHRYARLAQLADAYQITHVITAHHQDDQIETILMHIFRGSSVHGNGGMAAQRQFGARQLLRPLLSVSRAQMRAQAAQIAWREDASNAETVYRRNFFRHCVVPAWEAGCPGFSQALLEWAAAQRVQAHSYDARVDRCWHEVQAASALSVAQCAGWSEEERGTLWRRVFMAADVPLSRINIRRVDALFGQENGKKCELADWVFVKKSDRIAWMRRAQLLNPNLSLNPNLDRDTAVAWLPLPLVDACSHGAYHYTRTHVEGYTHDRCAADEAPETPEAHQVQAAIDAAKVQGCVHLRCIHSGERWQPLGAGGHKKIIKYLGDKKMPAAQRAQTVVLADATGVLWIPGYTIAERVKRDAATTACMVLTRALIV